MTVTRVALLLVVFAALAAWAGAQGPPPPLSAADRAKLFKTNRVLLANLVNDGIDLAKAGNLVERAEGARKTARTLANYMQLAAEKDQDADRVAELAGLMADVVRDGLVPNLEEGRRTFPPESKNGKELAVVQKQLTEDLTFATTEAVPAGPVAASEKVKAALARLAELKSKLGK
jgi:hypothetical protein